jgi:hypothetical protein
MVSGREMAAVSSRTNEPVGAVFWSNRRRGLVVGVVVAAAWLVGADAAVASLWRVEATPRIGGYLSAVSCSSASACTAVGPSLALRSHGSAWSSQQTAKPLASTGRHFNGVSCPSATACFAVGRLVDRTAAPVALAERWNGSSWSVQPVSTPGGRSYPSLLAAVSCTSATACTAVGSYASLTNESVDSPLIERWNGSSWSIQKAGVPPGFGADLTGVSCTARTLCTAVGEDYTDPVGQVYPIALRWTGRGWSLSQSAYQARVTSVSCTSAMACAWVGESSVHPVLGGWDGMHWTEGGTVAVPNPAFNTALNAVSCTAPNACTAVGGQGIALAWNGSVWSSQQTPTSLRLLGVSCTSSTVCTAVGPGVVERRS